MTGQHGRMHVIDPWMDEQINERGTYIYVVSYDAK